MVCRSFGHLRENEKLFSVISCVEIWQEEGYNVAEKNFENSVIQAKKQSGLILCRMIILSYKSRGLNIK